MSEDGPDLDLDALQRRYDEERSKRLRDDGTGQFHRLDGDFDTDPWADPGFTRAPVAEELEVVIIGGGFAGLMAGARLCERGITDVRIVEKGAGVGGTWYWNRYPGVACDVESYVYMPMLEETGYVPTERYARGAEILDHARRVAGHYGLGERALFQTAVKRLAWDAGQGRWIVTTDRDDRLAARFVISCTGVLSSAKLPAIPGVESFAGKSFHSSRWDYAYTGADLSRLADKRVGLIGTGSTGVQLVPALGPVVQHLTVFQRTPSTIDPRGNRPTDPAWAAALKPGWWAERRDNFTAVVSGLPQPADLVDDGWTAIVRETAGPGFGAEEAPDPAELRLAEMRKMERTRQRIAAAVNDPDTAEALKPYYHYFCKRPCFHDDYLDSFNRANVTLVDTKGQGVERVTPAGVVANGIEHALDCLIYGTGFEWLSDYGRAFGIEIVGEGGRRLADRWAEGARTLFGIQTRGFPNLFFMQLVQAAVSTNYLHTADEQTAHIAHVIAACLDRGVRTIQPTDEAERDWVEEVIALAAPRRAFMESCIPGYYNFEGRRGQAMRLNEFWCGTLADYGRRLAQWREAGDFPGMAIGWQQEERI